MKSLKPVVFICSVFLFWNSVSYGTECLILGISGGSASGKTTLAKSVVKLLKDENSEIELKSNEVGLLSQDDYFNPQQQPESDYVNGRMNFDHPSAMDFELMKEQIPLLKKGLSVSIPQYDFKTSSRKSERVEIGPYRVLIFEGIHVFHDEDLRKYFDYKVFVNYPDKKRLKRRMKRDLAERGSSFEETVSFYDIFVRPMFQKFIEPTQNYADLVVSGNSKTAPAEVVEVVKKLLEQN